MIIKGLMREKLTNSQINIFDVIELLVGPINGHVCVPTLFLQSKGSVGLSELKGTLVPHLFQEQSFYFVLSGPHFPSFSSF